MSMISLTFIVILIITLVIYWLIPQQFRNAFLLIISWGYMATWSWTYLVFLAGVVAISYIFGILIGRCAESVKKKQLCLTVSIITLIGILAIVKYSPSAVKVLGISFFTFQAVSYVMDVYRGDVETEWDIVIYALYVSFFPQLLSGPIAKAKEQLIIYRQGKIFDLDKIEKSLVLAVYGCFLKLVIADRIAIYVDDVYNNVSTSGRVALIFVILLYSVQIYCDFAGYTLMAIGIGRSFGIELPINFKQPYLARNINDFWKRWHISLTSWFRDYLYIQLGGNRRGRIRTYINVMVVFVVSGIWHGVGITFVLWGFCHGLLQIIEKAWVRIKYSSCVLTYLIVSVLWVLFRADTLGQAGAVLRGVFVNSNGFALSELTSHGLNIANLVVLAIAILVMIIVDISYYREICLLDKLFSCKLLVRWIILYVLIFSVIIVGVYGSGYDASNFIYYKF